MSYTVSFYAREEAVPSLTDFTEFLSSKPTVTVASNQEDGLRTFYYQNEDTGVYCSFTYIMVTSANDDDDDDADDLPPGYLRTPFTFDVNYIRPTFFAHEALALVDELCDRFDLITHGADPYDAVEAMAERRLAEWKEINASAIRTFIAKGLWSGLYVPEEKLTGWWRYMFVKSQIEESLGEEDIFVPRILMMVAPDDSPFSMIVWPNAIQQFFPPCDYILVDREINGPFGTMTQTGLARYDDVVTALEPYLVEQDTPSGTLKVLRNTDAEIQRIVRSLSLADIDLEEYRMAEVENLHDVAL